MGQSIQTQFAIGLQSLPALRWFVLMENEECFLLKGRNSSPANVAGFSLHPLHDEHTDATLFACSCAWLRRSIAMHVTFTRSRLHLGHTATLELPVDLHFCLHMLQMSLPKYEDIMREEPDLERGQ